jgi:hypothetical protein
MPLKSIAHAYDAADLSVLEQAYSWACREIDIDRARSGSESESSKSSSISMRDLRTHQPAIWPSSWLLEKQGAPHPMPARMVRGRFRFSFAR